MKVTGFVSSPSAGRGNRAPSISSATAASSAPSCCRPRWSRPIRTPCSPGATPPACCIWTLSYGSVDVNVHPAKTEVKFSFEKQVFDLVYNAVRLSLEQEDRTAEVVPSASTRKLIEPKADFYRSMSAESFRANGYAVEKGRGAAAPAPAARLPGSARRSSFRPAARPSEPRLLLGADLRLDQTRLELFRGQKSPIFDAKLLPFSQGFRKNLWKTLFKMWKSQPSPTTRFWGKP